MEGAELKPGTGGHMAGGGGHHRVSARNANLQGPNIRGLYTGLPEAPGEDAGAVSMNLGDTAAVAIHHRALDGEPEDQLCHSPTWGRSV